MSPSCRLSDEPVHARWLGTVDYLDAWDRQRAHAEARADGTGPDMLLLLEHPSVYTAGRRTTPADRPTGDTPVIDVDRGGRITWHGPGQLVGYPIIGLRQPYDVVDYVRRLEQALITVVESLGVPCGRVPGRSGVWLAADDHWPERPERKVAAIGVRVQRGVALHGFALNCNPDLTAFDRIVPCGIADAGVTSLSAELDRPVPIAEVLPAVRDAMLAALDGVITVAPHDLPPRHAVPAGVTLVMDPVRQLLEGEAETLTLEEAAERARTIAARSAVTADDVVDAIAEMREARS